MDINNNLEQMEYYVGVWKDIIIPHSNHTYNDIRPHLRETINKVTYLLGVKFYKNKSLSGQLDGPVVNRILELASILKSEPTIDSIYKRTRSSMFRYFHHEQIVKAYLEIGNEDKAINVINYILNKNHISYWYAVYNYDVEQFNQYPIFKSNLINLRQTSIAKLLAHGEKVKINFEAYYDDLVSLVNMINQYKENTLTQNGL